MAQLDPPGPDRPTVERDLVGRRTLDGERLIAVFSELVTPLGRSLPPASEVILHDLSLLPNSIVAVYGDVSGRRVGDPSTDLLLEQAVTEFRTVLGYQTKLTDGRRLRSSTMIIRDVFGTPVAALCINTDVTAWATVDAIAGVMTGRLPVGGQPQGPTVESVRDAPDVVSEVFASNVDELAANLIRQAIEQVSVPVKYMKKEHKLEVVRMLKSRGLFLIREAVGMVAESLEVTRFTIYNYLNELSDDADEAPRAASRPNRRKENG